MNLININLHISRMNKNIKNYIELLEAIKLEGSINMASKIIGITYKTAWKRLNKLKCLHDDEICVSYQGGNTRGGTYLTERGISILNEMKNEIN
jgi:molybdate transport system regulatory protein